MVQLCSELIQIDSVNTGDPATIGDGEARAARYLQQKLDEVGYETTYVEAGAPGRGNVFSRLAGADPERGALLIHGHVDVVPAEAADWTVDPFSGAVRDGYVWGRGAVDMKDMVGHDAGRRTRVQDRRVRAAAGPDLRLHVRRGGRRHWGAQWLVDHHPELFDGCTEAISEVGGFSIASRTTGGPTWSRRPRRALPGRISPRRGRAGHGSMINDDNAVTGSPTRSPGSVARVPDHPHRHGRALPRRDERADRALSSPRRTSTARWRSWAVSRIINATLRNTANPTMLKAGYKANVIPSTAEAVVDCRVLPGRQDELRGRGRRGSAGRHPDWVTHSARTRRLRRAPGGRDERGPAGRGPESAHRAVHACPAAPTKASRGWGFGASGSLRCDCRRTWISRPCSTASTNGYPWTR